MKAAAGFLFGPMNDFCKDIFFFNFIRADRIDALCRLFVHVKRKVRAPQGRMHPNRVNCFYNMESATEKIPLNFFSKVEKVV